MNTGAQSLIRVENYRMPQVITISPDSQNLSNRRELCDSLGLTIQSKLANPKVSPHAVANQFYPSIQWNQLVIWNQFLPKSYSLNKGQWREYQFDVIPNAVLEEINFAHQSGMFSDIEIWTPETVQVDPLAVGIIGQYPKGRRLSGNAQFYALARWGESLLPFNQIKQRVINHFLNTYGSEAQIPSHVLQAMKDKIEKDLNQGLYPAGSPGGWIFAGQSPIWTRHCGQRMFIFDCYFYSDNRMFLCSKCQFTKLGRYGSCD